MRLAHRTSTGFKQTSASALKPGAALWGVVSRVPKCEGPGAPILSGAIQLFGAGATRHRPFGRVAFGTVSRVSCSALGSRSRGKSRLHLQGQMRHNSEHSFNEHELRSMMHLMFLHR